MSDESKSTIELPTPAPVTTSICDLCGEPWPKHEEWQKNRTRSIHDDEPPYDLIVRKVPPITMMTCIYILQHKNQGPTGYPGVSGPMGSTGARGPAGRSFDDPEPSVNLGGGRSKEATYGLPEVP